MKLSTITICSLLCLLFVQCDSPERRKKKAEEIIEKHLFETLDNYKSYEKISTDVDTLHDLWMVDKEILALGDSLAYANSEYRYIENEIESLKGQLHHYKNSAINSLFGSSNGVLNYLSYSSKYDNCNSKIAKYRKSLQQQGDKVDDIKTRISDLNKAIVKPEKPYWLVTHKYRYSYSGEDTRIRIMNFIFDPKVKEILYSWDDEQLGILNMIDDVNMAIEDRKSEGKCAEPTDSI